MSNEKSGLANRLAGSIDDILNNKPQEEIEADLKRNNIQTTTPKSLKLNEILEDKPFKRTQTKTAKGKRIPVTTYFYDEDYTRFEEIRDSLQKAVRRETEIKLKEANIVEISVLWMMEEFEKNPNRIIEKFAKYAKKLK